MTITPTTLTRAAGAAAVVAGLIFIGVQINHPHADVSNVTTTEWAVRNSLKVLMAALVLVGITGMYLRQVKQIGVLGLIGYVVLGIGYLLILSTAFVSGVRPARRSPTPIPATSTTSSPRRPAAPPRATSVCCRPSSGCRASATWPAASSSASRCSARGVLARWAAVLLAVGGVVSVALAVMPDAFYRFLAFPNGIAMIALGYSLWRSARIDTTSSTVPATADDRVRQHGRCRMTSADRSAHPTGAPAPAGCPGPVELAGPAGAGGPQPHPGDLRIAPADRGRRRPAADADQPAYRRLPGARGGARASAQPSTHSSAHSSSPPGCVAGT